MKKRIVSLMMSIILAVSLLPVATLAASMGPGLNNFVKQNTYVDGQFTDVPSSEWYAESVRNAYELDLVKGVSDTIFRPDGNLTIAEALALACRLHSIYYTGSGEFQQGSPWYQVYVEYAINSGIITAGNYSNYNAAATRAQFSSIFAKALPNDALKAINTVSAIPDVPTSASYANAVYLLYNAGILTGNDEYGTFSPERTIKRSEVAAIVTRMACVDMRKSITSSESFSVSCTNYQGNLVLKWDAVPGAKGYQIMCGTTENPKSEDWGQAGICESNQREFSFPLEWVGKNYYWQVYALDYDPVYGNDEDIQEGKVIAGSELVYLPSYIAIEEPNVFKYLTSYAKQHGEYSDGMYLYNYTEYIGDDNVLTMCGLIYGEKDDELYIYYSIHDESSSTIAMLSIGPELIPPYELKCTFTKTSGERHVAIANIYPSTFTAPGGVYFSAKVNNTKYEVNFWDSSEDLAAFMILGSLATLESDVLILGGYDLEDLGFTRI